MGKQTINDASYSDKWGTPPEWLRWVGATLGSNYHDPCPADWLLGDLDGLTHTWPTNVGVYVNHPGGRGNFLPWFSKFMSHDGPKIWCGFNLSQLRLSCASGWALFDTPGYLVLPHKRVPYVWLGPDTSTRRYGEAQTSPTQDSFFWSSVEPAKPPVNCTIARTGGCREAVEVWMLEDQRVDVIYPYRRLEAVPFLPGEEKADQVVEELLQRRGRLQKKSSRKKLGATERE